MNRLIVEPPATGIWNMAVDESLLSSAANYPGTSTLRFYQWSEPTLSLGYFQRFEDRKNHAESISCPIVRRSTGGGAIVHDRGELTYSLTTHVKNRLSRDMENLYLLIHEALIESLKSWDVYCQFCESQITNRSADQPFLCFQRRSYGDVLWGNSKVAGSAQRRQKNGILQHGSVLFRISQHAPQLPGIEQLNSVKIDVFQLIQRWKLQIEKHFGVSFHESELYDEEIDCAKSLVQDRFDHEKWTMRR